MTAYTAPLILCPKRQTASFDDIKQLVCEYLRIDEQYIFSKDRNRQLVEARQFIMLLCRRYTVFTLKEIGKYMNGLDHTTVMHGTKVIQDLIQTDLLVRDKWHYFKTQMQLRFNNRFS